MTGTAPKVSVLLPVRNGEPFFAAALESVLAQEGVRFEVIVVDDGSSDGTPSLLAKCRDRRLRVLRREGGGLVAALNAAIAAARGEYCARMDADDIALPGRLAMQAAALDAASDAVMAHSAATLIDARGKITGTIGAPQLSPAQRRAILLAQAPGPPIVHPSVMIRRSALAEAGGYRDSPSCEDHELWLRLNEQGEFLALPQSLLLYRQHDLGISCQRTAEQAASNIANCVAARWREISGVDLMRDQPPVWEQLLAEARVIASGFVQGMANARALRLALRQLRLLRAASAALQLVRGRGVWLLQGAAVRRQHRQLQDRLLDWLQRPGQTNPVASGADPAQEEPRAR